MVPPRPVAFSDAGLLHYGEVRSENGAIRSGGRGACQNAPYRVRGKRYTPMSVADALQYHETGYASWYGGKARRLKTSSGEYINPQRSMTAAHKTLPMPCKVKVTCLETGKSTVVRINNRGPFHSNRLIDLTTAAASRIGLHRRGVSRVRLEIISVGDGPHEVSAR